MAYRGDWLGGNELVQWTKKHYPQVKIRKRKSTNNYAEARLKSDGTLLAFFTSNRELKNHMKTKKFKAELFKQTKMNLGFETAVFKGDGY